MCRLILIQDLFPWEENSSCPYMGHKSEGNARNITTVISAVQLTGSLPQLYPRKARQLWTRSCSIATRVRSNVMQEITNDLVTRKRGLVTSETEMQELEVHPVFLFLQISCGSKLKDIFVPENWCKTSFVDGNPCSGTAETSVSCFNESTFINTCACTCGDGPKVRAEMLLFVDVH